VFNRHSDSFAAAVGQRTQITEVSVLRKAEEPEKLEGRVVCEVVVERGMWYDMPISFLPEHSEQICLMAVGCCTVDAQCF
jgi:hypothetical protein